MILRRPPHPSATGKTASLSLPVRSRKGEAITVTRNGRPVFDLVPHRKGSGLRLEAIDEFIEKHGATSIVPYISDDFDAPLPEDFLLHPLPPDA